MIRTGSSIFQYRDRWCGVSVRIDPKGIAGVEFYPDLTFSELNQAFGETTCAVSISAARAYLVRIRFPFSGRRKIGLVIREELTEVFPFPMEEMAFDYEEQGKGNVLVAASEKAYVEGLKVGKHIRSVTVNSLSLLFALQHFRITAGKNFIFVHLEGSTAVIMASSGGEVRNLRQLYLSADRAPLEDAVVGYANDPEIGAATIYLMGDEEPVQEFRATVTDAVPIPVESPCLVDYIADGTVPDYAWPGLGAALATLAPKGGINLVRSGYEPFAGVDRKTMYRCAAVTSLSLVALGLSWLNTGVKETTLSYLSREETKIYRNTFPKAPPVKHVEGAFEEKIKAMEKDGSLSPAGGGASPLAVLADLSLRIDTRMDVKVNEFAYEGNEFFLSGVTVSFASVEKIKEIVGQVRGVRAAEIQNVDLLGAQQVKFRIMGKL